MSALEKHIGRVLCFFFQILQKSDYLIWLSICLYISDCPFVFLLPCTPHTIVFCPQGRSDLQQPHGPKEKQTYCKVHLLHGRLLKISWPVRPSFVPAQIISEASVCKKQCAFLQHFCLSLNSPSHQRPGHANVLHRAARTLTHRWDAGKAFRPQVLQEDWALPNLTSWFGKNFWGRDWSQEFKQQCGAKMKNLTLIAETEKQAC